MTLSLVLHRGTAIAVLLLFCACSRTSDTEKARVAEAAEAAPAPAAAIAYQADPNKSKLGWIGADPTGNHNGTIALREGTIAVSNGQVASGKFVFDMATLRAEDLELRDAQNKKLTGHLMSPDFFDVVRNPTAEFVITKVVPLEGGSSPAQTDTATRTRIIRSKQSKAVEEPTHEVTGNLTLKGTTKSITFPARLSVTDQAVTTQANFLIDRTDWKLNYRSEKSLGNKLIYPEVNIVLDVVANR